MAKGNGPEVLALSPTQLEELLLKLAGLLPTETYKLVETLLRTLQWVMGLLEAKNTTLGRLRRMIFGAKRLPVPHSQFHLGDLCPKCLKGKLYLLKTPARIVRIAAQPMYRTDKWQKYLGVPLAASTQWELMAAASKTPEVVYEALLKFAAQAELLHNDDTPMRVQSLQREISAAQDPDQRTGIFTTSIIAQVGKIPVALFFTGQKHAGENLNFPEECRQVIESLREI